MVTEVNDVPLQKEEVSSSETKPGKLLCCPQEGCGKVFRSSPGYRYHLKSHDIDPRPHVCHCCHKKFKSANGLKYHLRKAHHIEPVLSKQNLNGGVNQKNCDSLGSEDEHLFPLNDSYSRNFMNGSFSDRRPNIPSPLVKSPLGLSSPLMKNLPGIPSPLLKSPMDLYSLGGSAGSGINSPYPKDRYSHFYDKNENCLQRNGDAYSRRPPPPDDYGRQNSNDFSPYPPRNSLSEYTQQCQQANNDFRQQCQRLSSGSSDNYNSYPRSCEYSYCRKSESMPQHNSSGSYSSDYHRNSINRHSSNDAMFEIPCMNGEKDINGPPPRHCKDYDGCKDFPIPNEGKEYPNDLVNHNAPCTAPHVKTSYSSHNNSNNNLYDEPLRGGGGSNSVYRKNHISDSGQFKVQNTEQIVPDIGVPNNPSPPGQNGCDLSNGSNGTPKDYRGASESSNENELSDCAFQNESSDLPLSPPNGVSTSSCSSAPPSDLGFTIKLEPSSPSSSCAVTTSSTSSNCSDVSKPLLVRRTSKSKSIPPALVINPAIKAQNKVKDLNKLDPASRLRHLAEIATSPRSPLNNQMSLPLALTPSLLPPESTPHVPLKSPSRFSFHDKNFLLTPTISRFNPESSHTDSPITTTTSLPASPFLDNIQTPSFWPSQTWPIPVWLCFLQGCRVKFEQDDKEFMLTEDVAAYCTTPGGRRRDDMNFYTSGMKIVQIQEQDQSFNSAQDMVELTFEQVIPGTQRLVAKCPIDHPFYVKNKGWCAASAAEAMARYGIPFRTIHVNDTAIPSPQNKLNPTPGCNMSPLISSGKGPQVFTFNVQDTSKFSPPKKIEAPYEKSDKSAPSSSCISSKPQDTITLTYSAKSSQQSNLPYPHKNLSTTQPKLASELKSISEQMKQSSNNCNSNSSSLERSMSDIPKSTSPDSSNDAEKRRVPPRKKRRKPVLGNQEDRRPMNGFMLFAKKMRVELTKQFPGKDNRAVSKLLGENWRELSEEKRDEFARNAKEMADERMKVNPDCWKRKHRKDKDSTGKTIGDAMSQDPKKMKLPSPAEKLNDLHLPTNYVDSMEHRLKIEESD